MLVKLGTHNSWTYGKAKWYIPSFLSKCQKLNIQEQYNKGARLFDLRLRLKKDGTWGVSHGMSFRKVDYQKDLDWLNSLETPVYVRVKLEYNFRPKNLEEIKPKFREICKELEETYPGIKFFDGALKNEAEVIYQFKNPNLKLSRSYSSVTSLFKSNNRFLAIIDDWWPWLYAFLKNKENYENFVKNNRDPELWFFCDFIEMTCC